MSGLFLSVYSPVSDDLHTNTKASLQNMCNTCGISLFAENFNCSNILERAIVYKDYIYSLAISTF